VSSHSVYALLVEFSLDDYDIEEQRQLQINVP